MTSRYTAHVTQSHRIFYCNQETRTASWLPPPELWCGTSLPYGWEQAIDPDGKSYYINHVTKSTTYEDPRIEYEDDQNSKPRIVELSRDSELGFGFVAGSEKPVVVRYVIEGGPSEGKLLPSDLILAINDEDVQNTPREQVIQMVRNCPDSVKLKVRQPPVDSSTKKSALLSSAKKERLKTNPPRVRFAEGVIVNGSTVSTPFSGGETSCSPIPNILKVFLENGQTKSFKYDNSTKVKDVLYSLKNKLCIQAINNFALVLEQVKGLRRNKLTLLNPDHTIARIASRPGAHNLRCLFRVAFVPKDACILAQEDLTAFEYLYMQCCNDVVQERYAPELKYDTALRLAALHIHQHAISNNIPYNKITVKSIEKEFGLDKFVPISLMESMKRKELRKLLTHLLKLNQTITGTSHKTLTSLQAKLYYLTIISELPSYGAKCFSTNIRECNVETVILISPKVGISQIIGTRNSMPAQIADIEQLDGIRVQANDQITSYVTLYIPSIITKVITFTIEDRDAEELVLVLSGYYRLFTGRELPVSIEKEFWMQDAAPTYHTHHMVLPAPWSYTPDIDYSQHRYADFSIPPMYTNLHPHNVLNGKNYSQLKVYENGNRNYERKLILNDRFNTVMTDQNGYLLNKRLANHNELMDMQNILSMEMLENDDDAFIESRNREVIRRVTEMQELVQNSEHYLSQHQRELNDSGGSHICSLELDNNLPHHGQLKHSDSLLLLTQGQQEINNRFYEAMQALQLGDVESDTDSVSTPSNSPSRTSHNFNRDSGASFGLHSPDSVPTNTQHTLQDLWTKMRDSNTVSDDEYLYHFEPDVIDLTLIPPPDKVQDDECNTVFAEPQAPPAAFTDDRHSPTSEQQQRHDRLLDSVLSGLDNSQLMSLDLDSFLATTTVPPPTPNLISDSELTSEQISSFIIPPPPQTKENIVDDTNVVVDQKKIENEENDDNNNNSKIASKNRAATADDDTIAPNNSNDRNNIINYHNKDSDNLIAEISSRAQTPTASCSSATLATSSRNCSTLPARNKPRVRHEPPSIPPRIDSLNSLSRKNSSTKLPVQQNNNGRLACSKQAIHSIVQLKDEHNAILAQCNKAQSCGGGSDINETKFQDTIQELSDEARQLVTSSKSLVKSYMEPNCPNFASNLLECIGQLKITTELCNKLIAHTASPLQTRNLIQKVADLVNTFHDFISTVTENTETEVITKYAENLANVLATLLRSLRIFSP